MQGKIIAILLFVVILVCGTACNSQNADNARDKSTEQSSILSSTIKNEQSNSTISNSDNKIPLSNIWLCRNFSDDVAWVRDVDSVIYCIDKKGNVLLKYKSINETFKSDETFKNEENWGEVSDFSNGYATIFKYDKSHKIVNKLYVLDKKGNICSEYSFDTTNSFVLSNDGYTITQEHIKDFRSDYFKYTIYSPTKQVLHTIDTTDSRELSVKYVGKSAFTFGSINGTTNKTIHETYFAKNNKVVSQFCDGFFYEDIAYLDDGTIEESKDGGYHQVYRFMDVNGNILKVNIPSEYNWGFYKNGIVNADTFLCHNGRDMILSYNLKTQKLTKFDNASNINFDKIDYDKLTQHLYVNNGLIVLPMKGTDKNSYISVVDTNFNTVIEPIQISLSSIGLYTGKGDSHTYNDNRLVLYPYNDTSSVIYDNTGKILFTSKDKNYQIINKYKNNIAIVNAEPTTIDYNAPDITTQPIYKTNPSNMAYPIEDLTCLYIDENGNSLFDELTITDETKEIIID